MRVTNKQGRPSSLRLVLLALVTMVLGWGLMGSWVSCYYKCARGNQLGDNYYAAVWTGGLAILSGLLQLYLACCWKRALKRFMFLLNGLVLLACLLCAALYGRQALLEVLGTPDEAGPRPTVGVILSGLQAVLAVLVMLFVMIACAAEADARADDDEYPRPKFTSSRGRADLAETCFIDRVPGIYKTDGQERQRPQEVSSGEEDGDGCPGNGDRGNGRRSHPGGAILVDGLETSTVWLQ